MSKTKRSLEDAFDLTPEVSLFVNNESPEEAKKATKQPTTNSKATPQKKTNLKPKVKKAPAPVQLDSYSVRIPVSLIHRLIRCATNRRLEGKPNCTQQDIVAQAISDWLDKHE